MLQLFEISTVLVQWSPHNMYGPPIRSPLQTVGLRLPGYCRPYWSQNYISGENHAQFHTASSFLNKLDISLTHLTFLQHKNGIPRHLSTFTTLVFLSFSYC